MVNAADAQTVHPGGLVVVQAAQPTRFVQGSHFDVAVLSPYVLTHLSHIVGPAVHEAHVGIVEHIPSTACMITPDANKIRNSEAIDFPSPPIDILKVVKFF